MEIHENCIARIVSRSIWPVTFLAMMVGLCIASSNVNGNPVVEAPVGKIKGLADNITVPGKMVNKFLGIPYAKPPVGNLRFSKPLLVEDFPAGQTFDATISRQPCVQHGQKGVIGDEDCLFLNIFVPSRASNDAPVSVMVWVHGGAFQFDTAANYEGTVLAEQGQVIVVTLNYRLGVLGFLNIKDSQKPSNFGLWDQHTALKWVQKNIRAFGGDPRNVTLFGESAGAAGVAYHTLSPHSKGLFRRVILQSGTALAPWAQNRYPRRYAIDFLQRTGCRDPTDQGNDIDAMLTCLRTKSSSEIFEKSHQIDKGDKAVSMINFIWVPSVDEDFIPRDPSLMINDEGYLKTVGFFELDLLLGINNDEGSLVYLLANLVQIVGQNKTVNPDEGISKEFFKNKFLPAILRQKFVKETKETIMAMEYMYEFSDKAGCDNSSMVSFAEWFQTYADTSFLSPITQHALSHSSRGEGESNTYLYLFDFRPSYEADPRIKGTTHGGDVPFVFGFVPSMKASMQNYSMEEGQFAKQVIKYWTNFARSGNPNLPDDMLPATWPSYDPEGQAFIKLSPTMTSASKGHGLYRKRAEFWLNFLPAIMPSDEDEAHKADKTKIVGCVVPDTGPSTVLIALATTAGVLGILLVIVSLVIVYLRCRKEKSNYTMN